MSKIAIIIEESDRNNVSMILKQIKVPFYEAGYPNGKVTITESYPSSMNKKIDENKPTKPYIPPITQPDLEREVIKVVRKTNKVSKPIKKTFDKTEIVKQLTKKPKKPKNLNSESAKMHEFAKQLGCSDISSAILKVGNGAKFRKRFVKEYLLQDC